MGGAPISEQHQCCCAKKSIRTRRINTRRTRIASVGPFPSTLWCSVLYSDKDKGSKGKGKGMSKGKNETRYCHDCGEQGHIGVNCPYKWAYSIDEQDDQISSWESELVGENAEELASLETPDEEGEWCWPVKSRVTR